MSKPIKFVLILTFILLNTYGFVGVSTAISTQSVATPASTFCAGTPPTRLIPHSAAMVVPGQTAELGSKPELNSDILAVITPYYSLPLTGDPVCAESYLWWPVDYYDGNENNQSYSGWIAENDEQSYVLQPQPSASTIFSMLDTQATIHVQYGGIGFEYAGILGKSISAITVHAAKVSPASGIPDIGEHIEFTFEEEIYVSRGIPATISIYVADDPAPLNSRVQDQIDMIQAILRQEPVPLSLSRFLFESDPNKPDWGIYPPVHSGQWFRAQHKYLTFQNGTGIRFVAMYSRVNPQRTNDGLVYSVQAVSDDGKYLVSAIIPIMFNTTSESEALLSDINNLPFDEFQQKVRAYGAMITDEMDRASSAEFVPNLDSLDSLITSLCLGVQ